MTIAGHLSAADLRRLERTCAPALEHNPTPLDLRVDHLTGLDEPARLFLVRLVERGALLVGRSEIWASSPPAGSTTDPSQ